MKIAARKENEENDVNIVIYMDEKRSREHLKL